MLVALAAFAILIALARLRTYHEPVDWDIGTYAVVAHELNHGEKLYADVWDMKPPGIFATYQVAEWIAGYGYGQIYLLGTVSAIVTMLGIYAAGSVFGRGAGLFAAACYAIVQSDLGLEANRPNTEAFINACTAVAFALVVRMRPDRLEIPRAVAMGAVLALGSMYKQVAVAIFLPVIIVDAMWTSRGFRRRGALPAILMLTTMLAVWIAIWGYFATTRRGQIFWETAFVYPQYYASNLGASFSTARLFPSILLSILPSAAIAVAGLCFAIVSAGSSRLELIRRWLMLVALLVGTQIAIILPSQYFAHYYQLWLVPLSIGAGWGLVVLLELRPRWIGYVGGAVVLFALVFQQIPSYLLPARQWAIRQHGEILGKWLQPVAQELDSMLKPDETFYQWADEPWLYFATRRRPPATALWRMHTIDGPLAAWLTQRTLEDLERSKPKIIVVWHTSARDDHPIARWIARNYVAQPDAAHRYPLLFFVRREG